MESRSAKLQPVDQQGTILRIERGSIHDGEGLRTVVFLKGCPLSCIWCSTPESQKRSIERGYRVGLCKGCLKCIEVCPENALTAVGDRVERKAILCGSCLSCAQNCPAHAITTFGRNITVAEVFHEILRDEVFYFHSGGGVTISGGECLLQPGFVAAIAKECRHCGIDTAIETSMHVAWESIETVLPYLTSIYVDLKHPFDKEHRYITGTGNRLILANIKKLASHSIQLPVHLRIPLIPGLNDSNDALRGMAAVADRFDKICDIEILPYHRLGTATYPVLQRDYSLANLKSPSADYISERINYLQHHAKTPIIGAEDVCSDTLKS